MQGRFVGTSAYEAAFVGGIGSGKSIAGCMRAVFASQGIVGGKHRLQTPNLGVITAPTYPMLRDATQRAFFEVAQGLVKHFNKSDGLVTLKNGSEIIFRSTEHPDRLRGPSIAWWFGDEAAMYDRSVWDVMVGRLRQFGERGYAWLATTPRGRNWVWQLFVQGIRAGRKIFKASSADNVYLDPAIVAAWRATYTGDFALQELEGEFIAFEGLIYPEFRREVHVVSRVPDTFAYTVCGVDWGFANPGVILVLGVDSDDRLWLVEEHYQRQRLVDDWAEVAKQVTTTWRPTRLYCDPSEPDYIRTFREAGVPAVKATTTVNTGLQAVKNRLVVQPDGRPRLLVARSAVQTAAEFESYQWAENKYGTRDEPLKANDHAMDALRYACMGIDKRKPITATTRRYA
jgi:phage terminase large subunit